ncbi:hypothetical protein ATI61_110407 [Archangium gephyra]|uniref:Uncharacterized protein n=1 Tax=Archangium gephyra TaxID=48 RepID=A0AAC8QEK5_9BACT|nr:hypothetical protein [Archangium gephyra]AKJ05843.1 Hypothetical protein AA314_07469 [Archangium gephyra]REG27400.1 hypothetical protein ATI61_110407 [Archangium gephyra]
MSTRIGNNTSTFAATTAARTAGPTIKAPTAEELKGVKSGSELGTDLKLGVTTDSKLEDVQAALGQLVGKGKGDSYGMMIEGLGKAFKGRALEGIQKDMAAWLKDNKNATPAQVFEQASKVMMKQVLMNQTFKQTIDQMASAAVSRMKDTFEG